MLGTHFVVRTDNVANTYFKTQKKLSAKQARWQELLEEYDGNTSLVGTTRFLMLSAADVQFPLLLAFMLICLFSLSGAVTSVSPPFR